MHNPARKPRRVVVLTLSLAMLVAGLVPAAAAASDQADPKGSDRGVGVGPQVRDTAEVTEMPDERIGFRPCVQGRAGPFPCHQVDLMTFLPPDEFGGGPSSFYGGPGNDSWGWTDPETGREWVLMGRANGTSFIDISDPKRPVLVADLPTQTGSSLWRDIKVYDDYAFVVSEASGHGMQSFDLTRLRDVDLDGDLPVTVDPDAHYPRFGNAHNLVINEDTGFAYGVGTTGDVSGGNPCRTGLHMVDIRDPEDMEFAGCFDEDGYTHDAQCVVYHGPDERFQGREICFASNPGSGLNDTLTVVDVTDKENPVMLSRTYQGAPSAYSHQGWLTEDHRYFLHNDESDNMASQAPGRTRTRVFDVRSLTDVSVQAVHHSETRASAHNLYVKGRYAYLANYFDGLRVVDITNIDQPGDEYAPETPELLDHRGLQEVGCFNTDPVRTDAPGFGGTWSNYPFFDSGVVAVSGFDGLFLVKPRIGGHAEFPGGPTNRAPNDNRGPSNLASYGCLGDGGSSGDGPGVPHNPGHGD